MPRLIKIPRGRKSSSIKIDAPQSRLASLMQQGLVLHRQEKFNEAKIFYAEVLSFQENHFDALQLLGALLSQTQEFEQSVEYLSRALKVDPSHAASHSNRSNALKALGRLDEALSGYDAAINLDPKFIDAYCNRGMALLDLDRLEEALSDFQKAITLDIKFPKAYFHRGIALQKKGLLDEALSSFNQAISLKPMYSEAHFNKGVLLKQLGQISESLAFFDKAIAINPKFSEAYCNRGIALEKLGRLEESLNSYNKAIDINQNLKEAYSNRGIVLEKMGKLDESLLSYDEAITLDAAYSDAYANRGNTLISLGRLEEAVSSFNRAISLNPNNHETYSNLGLTLANLERLDDALMSYDSAISLNPKCSKTYSNRGILLHKLGRLDDALISYDKALDIDSEYAEALSNRGITLDKLGRFEEAIISFDRAIKLKPDYPKAYSNRGLSLASLHRLDDAVIDYDRAISIDSEYAEAYSNRGIALQSLRKFDEALESYYKAISLNPVFSQAYYNLGIALEANKKLDEALANYEKAINLSLDFSFLQGAIFYIKMFMGDWRDFDNQKIVMLQKIRANKKVSQPFSMLSLDDCPLEHKLSAQIFSKEKYPAQNSLGNIQKYCKQKKIRIGYFSADFRNHAVSYLTSELFERHNKEKFDLFAFSFNPENDDAITTRLKKSFHQFIDVRNLSDLKVAETARDLQIDIAIDLGGYTTHSRTGIFAYRAAPIQVNWLGYPGTMGVDYIDYIIADKTIIPETHQHFYTEKVVVLPDTYMVDDSFRVVSSRVFTRQECNLPDDAFVFCCFNNGYKINPQVLDSWSKILVTVENSVFWISENNKYFRANIANEFRNRGVDASRIIFANRVDLMGDHLARYGLADLFLDTHPYNAHTTAVDSLKASLPVLTLIGQSFASRVASSLLSAIGLPELVTHTREEYEALAIELAKNPQKLLDIKSKLAHNYLSAPLFNTPLFTKNIEAAYMQMMERYWNDLPPEHLSV